MTDRFRPTPCHTDRLVRYETGAINTEHYRIEAKRARDAAMLAAITGLQRSLGQLVAQPFRYFAQLQTMRGDRFDGRFRLG